MQVKTFVLFVMSLLTNTSSNSLTQNYSLQSPEDNNVEKQSNNTKKADDSQAKSVVAREYMILIMLSLPNRAELSDLSLDNQTLEGVMEQLKGYIPAWNNNVVSYKEMII